jgi:hypothetical protein
MMMFFKKSGGPPDIGEEESYDSDTQDMGEKIEDFDDSGDDFDLKRAPRGVRRSSEYSVSDYKGDESLAGRDLKFERMNARIDSVVEWLHQFSERFSIINEAIGQVKASSLMTEKKIIHATVEADKVVDIVREVKPERLRIEYQKMELKLAAVSEKIDANKQLMVDAMNEINDIRRKSEVFIGTDSLLKLNKDTKKDIVGIKKLSSRVKMEADKVQEIFLEVGRNFSETQKSMQQAEDVRSSFEDLRKEFEKLKLDHGEIVTRKDLAKIRRESLKVISDMKNESEKYDGVARIAESALEIAKRNEADVGDLGLKLGDSGAKKISDYESALDDVLGLVAMLTEQVNELKAKVGAGPDSEISQAVNAVLARRGGNFPLSPDAIASVPPRRFSASTPIPAPIPDSALASVPVSVEPKKKDEIKIEAEPVEESISEPIESKVEMPVEEKDVAQNNPSVDDVELKKESVPIKKKVVKKIKKKSIKKKIPKKKLDDDDIRPIENVVEPISATKEEEEEEGFLSKYKKLFS